MSFFTSGGGVFGAQVWGAQVWGAQVWGAAVGVICLVSAGAASAQSTAGVGDAPITPATFQASPNSGPVIQAISVQGNQRIEPETVASYLVVQPGDVATEQLLDLGLKTLMNTGLFHDVRLAMQPGGTLLIELEENPIVNRVILEGNKKVKEDKLTEEVQLAPRAVFTRAKAQGDVQRITEVYRAGGRFAATVTPKVKPLEQNRVDVIYEIDEGPKTGVAKINFIGNNAFSSAELRGELLTKESRWWRFFATKSTYDPDKLEYERDLLRQFYAKNGYADFQVISAVAELTPDRKDFFITFTIDEGEKYEIGDVKVKTTLDRLDEGALERFVPVRTGQTYNGERVEKAVESLTFATGSLGYAFVDVQPRLDRNPANRTMDVIFEVNEGPRVYVDRINIKGNTRTLDKVIRRELRLAEGDAFNRIAMDRSKARINSLQYFSEVEIEEKPGSGPDRVELDVSVEERSTGAFSVGVGVSSTDNFIVDFSIEERNLMGRGQFLRLRAQSSSRTRLVDLRFTQPYFLDRNLSAGVSIGNSRTDFREVGIIRNRYSLGLNAGFQVSEYGRGSVQYQLAHDNIVYDQETTQFSTDPNTFISTSLIPGAMPQVDSTLTFRTTTSDATLSGTPLVDSLGRNYLLSGGTYYSPTFSGFYSPLTTDTNGNLVLSSTLSVDPTTLTTAQAITLQVCDIVTNAFSPQCSSRGKFLTSLFGYSLGFDTRDNPVDTKRGWRASIAQSVAGLGGDVNYWKTEGNAAYYKHLFAGFVAKLEVRGGYIDGYNNNTIRLQDRFYEGAGTFRGFEVAGVGPRYLQQNRLFDRDGNLFGQAIGAKVYGIGTAEIRLPLPLPPEYGIRAAIFSDFGAVGLVDDQDKLINENLDFWVDPDGDGIFIKPIQDDLSLRVSAGVSISWDSPFGPVRFDIAEVLMKEDYDRTEGFRFSAGTSF